MDAGLNKNEKLWEDINNIIPLGRSGSEIGQALYLMGYDKKILKKILTVKFMDLLREKEQRFVEMQRSGNNNNFAAEQSKREELETLTQRNSLQIK